VVLPYRAEIARIAGGDERVWPIVGNNGEVGGLLALDPHNVQVVEMAFDLRENKYVVSYDNYFNIDHKLTLVGTLALSR